MMYDRMEPLTPIKEPTVVNSGLSNMKPVQPLTSVKDVLYDLENSDHSPSATSAKPEYAFRTVITTAIRLVS